jgi:hypothetical protein
MLRINRRGGRGTDACNLQYCKVYIIAINMIIDFDENGETIEVSERPVTYGAVRHVFGNTSPAAPVICGSADERKTKY